MNREYTKYIKGVRFSWIYMNAPDISDPQNKLRVFVIVVGKRFFRLTWEWPKLEWWGKL